MSIDLALENLRHDFNGRKAELFEINQININFEKYQSEWLIRIFSDYSIIGCIFLLSNTEDESTIGVDMKWMSPSEIISEIRDTYPGKAAFPLGYVPIGICMEGSGDYYYVKLNCNSDPPLYRILHNAVDENTCLIERCIESVSNKLSHFFDVADISK
jgi:hypothetical protein